MAVPLLSIAPSFETEGVVTSLLVLLLRGTVPARESARVCDLWFPGGAWPWVVNRHHHRGDDFLTFW